MKVKTFSLFTAIALATHGAENETQPAVKPTLKKIVVVDRAIELRDNAVELRKKAVMVTTVPTEKNDILALIKAQIGDTTHGDPGNMGLNGPLFPGADSGLPSDLYIPDEYLNYRNQETFDRLRRNGEAAAGLTGYGDWKLQATKKSVAEAREALRLAELNWNSAKAASLKAVKDDKEIQALLLSLTTTATGESNVRKSKLQIAYDNFMKEKANMQSMLLKIQLDDKVNASDSDLTALINADAKFQLQIRMRIRQLQMQARTSSARAATARARKQGNARNSFALRRSYNLHRKAAQAAKLVYDKIQASTTTNVSLTLEEQRKNAAASKLKLIAARSAYESAVSDVASAKIALEWSIRMNSNASSDKAHAKWHYDQIPRAVTYTVSANERAWARVRMIESEVAKLSEQLRAAQASRTSLQSEYARAQKVSEIGNGVHSHTSISLESFVSKCKLYNKALYRINQGSQLEKIPLVDCSQTIGWEAGGHAHKALLQAYGVKSHQLWESITMFGELIKELRAKLAAAQLRLSAEMQAAKATGARSSTQSLTINGLSAAESALESFKKNAYQNGGWGSTKDYYSSGNEMVDVSHGHPVLSIDGSTEKVSIPVVTKTGGHTHRKPVVIVRKPVIVKKPVKKPKKKKKAKKECAWDDDDCNAGGKW